MKRRWDAIDAAAWGAVAALAAAFLRPVGRYGR
jgi:hypothetical protein